jgi:hypothetical protein
MNPAELRVIKRLAARVNVLPVIARTDALTESRLNAVKRTVRRELESAGVGFGVFEPSVSNGRSAKTNGHKTPVPDADDGRRATMDERREDALQAEGGEDDDDDERKARPVIRIRSRKSFTGTERSQSRRRRSAFDASPERSDGDEVPPPVPDGDAAINGYSRLNKSVLSALLPFALVSPQHARRRNVPKASEEKSDTTHEAAVHQNGNGELLTPSATATEGDREPQTPVSSITNRRSWSSVPPSAFPTSYQTPQNVQSLAAAAAAISSEYGPPRTFPRGQFTRKYKWGTLDVLDPAHCDFVALRTAVLSTHFRGLKVNTREVLYERYRTEKLLARRATRNIGGEERKRLLQDLGL